MKKAILELLIIVGLFFSLWFVLSRIDWVSVFKIDQVTKSTEDKLGDLFWELFSKTENEIHSKAITSPVDSLIESICDANDIDKSQIKIHVLKKAEVNAFALPNRHLIIYSGLIESCDNEAELCGVVGHEIAHMEKNHVMKKLVKEVGLSVLISMSSGNGNSEVIKKAAKVLSSSAYDRKLESEADMASVDYLLKAKIDPEPFANFLYKLADEEKNIPSQVYWISTHPESKERAENIIKYIKGKKIEKHNVLTPEQWENLKTKLKDID